MPIIIFYSFANFTPFCQTESPSLCKSFEHIAKKVEVFILSGKFGKKLKFFNIEQSLYYITDGNHKVILLSYRWTFLSSINLDHLWYVVHSLSDQNCINRVFSQSLWPLQPFLSFGGWQNIDHVDKIFVSTFQSKLNGATRFSEKLTRQIPWTPDKVEPS